MLGALTGPLRRGLAHYRRLHLAVGLGAAVATAVLCGALLVGDSMRGSLRAMTLDRLGAVEHALTAPRLLGEGLVTALEGELQGAQAIGVLALDGTALDAVTRRRAAGVQILGVDGRFAELWDDPPPLGEGLTRPPGQPFAPVALNRALQRELGVEVGQDILLSFERPSEVQRETLFGERRSEEVLQTLRLRLVAVLDDEGAGRFGLRPHQNRPLNAYIDLAELQRALDAPGRVNTLLTTGGRPEEVLTRVWRLADAGLALSRAGPVFSLESPGYLLGGPAAAAARSAATMRGLVHRSLFTYLATSLRLGGSEIPYSLVSGLDEGFWDSFTWIARQPGRPADDAIVLNAWAAERLEAKPGQTLALDYFAVDARDELVPQTVELRVHGIVAMEGPGADPGLTPAFPGLHQADDMAAWDAPFPVELERVTEEDEAYWDRYAAAPKAFVSLKTAQRLWQSRFGLLSAVRLQAGAEGPEALAEDILGRLEPGEAGLFFRPVRREGLEASAGATDFGGLFIGFSLFLIVSGALLVGLLFRLGVEGRAPELGLLLSLGYTVGAVRRRLLAEGLVVAALGGIVGAAVALFYAELMLEGLRTWWSGAVGSGNLRLHVEPLSLAVGYSASLVVVMLAVWGGVRGLSRLPPPALLRGLTARPASGGGRARWVGFGGVVLGVVLSTAALAVGGSHAAGLFFGAGAAWLAAGLGFFGYGLQRLGGLGRQRTAVLKGTGATGVRNSGRFPGRSLLCAGLVACAAFVVVAVGANRRPPLDPAQALRRDAGTGGFALVGQTAVGLHGDLDTVAGRARLGFDGADEDALSQGRVYSLRRLPGEDASCLNLYRPQRPTILGVGPGLRQRGGFSFQEAMVSEDLARAPTGVDAAAGGGGPWSLLEADLGEGVVPAIADFNSAQWILHLGLGDELVVEDDYGRPLRLRLVALLRDSIFQGEVLVAAEAFERFYPSQSGYGFFLLETGAPQAGDALERVLGPYGFDATTTSARLAAYHAVENTYLSTFQSLGGLGLLLGTVGLGVVLLRNALERRGELAALRAFGFRRWQLAWLLLAENAFLLLAGLAIGSAAALVAVLPQLLDPASSADWGGLLAMLGLVVAVGLGASAGAALLAARGTLVAVLKGD